MNPEDVLKMQNAAYVYAQSIAALATIEGMKAENWLRQDQGKTIAYDEEAFLKVVDEYGLNHNDVIDSLGI